MFELKTETRDIKANPKVLRGEGKLPAVFYGRKEKSTPITLDSIQFKKIWKEAGESSIVTLKTAGGEIGAIIHDVQMDPVRGEPTHVDFYVVEQDKPIEVSVPLEFIGVSPAVKDLGGVLVKVLHEIEIEALPKDLPHSIVVDISSLAQIDSHITAKDLPLSRGVTLVTKEGEIVALVSAAREEKEEEAPAAIDMSAIEVEKKGKKEEEGGEAGATEEDK
jgi:large subunit ribosomal protein L25